MEIRSLWSTHIRIQDPQSGMDLEIRRMFGSGLLSQGEYLDLKEKLRKGRLGKGDLLILQKRPLAGNCLPASKLYSGGRQIRDRLIEKSLTRVYVDRSYILDAHLEAEQVIETAKNDLRKLQEQAKFAGDMARDALPDEGLAREFLDTKYILIERARVLEQRIHSLGLSLQRIDVLQGKLLSAETELNLLDAQQHLAALEVRVENDSFSSV